MSGSVATRSKSSRARSIFEPSSRIAAHNEKYGLVSARPADPCRSSTRPSRSRSPAGSEGSRRLPQGGVGRRKPTMIPLDELGSQHGRDVNPYAVSLLGLLPSRVLRTGLLVTTHFLTETWFQSAYPDQQRTFQLRILSEADILTGGRAQFSDRETTPSQEHGTGHEHGLTGPCQRDLWRHRYRGDNFLQTACGPDGAHSFRYRISSP